MANLVIDLDEPKSIRYPDRRIRLIFTDIELYWAKREQYRQLAEDDLNDK